MDELKTDTAAKPAKTDEQKAAEEKLLAALKDEQKLSADATQKQRENEIADLEFESGEHWSQADIAARKLANKPTLSMDLLSGYIQQVNNEPVHRIVVTAHKGATPVTAESWQGVCRRVENLSNAEDVYKWGRIHVLRMGRGFWRVRADVFMDTERRPDGVYDASVFNQDIRIEPILNQHTVYEDPRCRMLDFSDQRFCIIGEDLQWEEIKRLYPQATKTTAEAVRATGDCPPDWATEETGRVLERYYIEDDVFTLCMLADGSIVQKDDKTPYPTGQVKREHTFRVPKVKWMKSLANAEILEGPLDVPGRYIPVVKIVGERRIVNGKEDNRGMVRASKDPMRAIDFGETRLWEAVDMATMSTWLTAAEGVDGFAEWDELANGGRPARLRWNAFDEDHPERERLPEPRHVSTAPIVAPLVAACQRASMNLRHVMGAPDVAPEETRPEVSGVAIGRRDLQRKQSTSHYADSTKAGIRLTGRIIIAMGRQVYDVPQILRITGIADDEIELIPFKGADQQAMAQEMADQSPQAENGAKQAIRRMLDISVGEFDVDVTAGKGYQTGRQETVEAVTAMVQVAPGIAPIAIPTILENSDFPGAAALAKKLQPPDPNSGMVSVADAQKAQQVIDHLSKETIPALEQQIKDLQSEQQTKLTIAQQDQQTKVQIEHIKQQGAVDLAKVNAGFELQKAEIEAKRDIEVAKLQPPPAPGGPGNDVVVQTS